jgi:predicted neutral ceramidase superfamily lipid hydrolase
MQSTVHLRAMQAPLGHSHLSPAQAADRLRYLNEVQRRTRRASLSPAFGLLVVGVIALAHGLVITLWPHSSLEWLVLGVAIVAARPLNRWLHRRLERQGLEARRSLRVASAVAALGFVILAIATGANPLVSALAAATALMALFASMPVVSLAATAVGLIGDFAIRQGLSAGTGQILVGAAFLAVGLATSMWQGRSHEPPH